MYRIFHNTTYDFIKWWRQAVILTLLFIGIGMASFLFRGGVNYSIEFTGGTLLQVRFAQAPDPAELRRVVGHAEITQFGEPTVYTLRVQGEAADSAQASSTEGTARAVRDLLQAKYGDGFTIERTEAVSARVGDELARGAAIAMAIAAFITLIYLAFRFEWRFGVSAVLSTLHDILITLAFIKMFHIEVSLTVVAAILTLLGYSGNDTIIIFDRVRENLKKARREPLYDTLNRSINETLPRSVLTHAMTLAATLALLLFAGEVLQPFAAVMTFGIFVATFSSIYVASPLLLYIERRFPRTDATGKGLQVAASTARAESKVEPAPRPARDKTSARR
jgi:preprotein translocase subunit SecF